MKNKKSELEIESASHEDLIKRLREKGLINVEGVWQKKTEELSKKMIDMAHADITRKKGKKYAPDVHEIQKWVDDYINKNS